MASNTGLRVMILLEGQWSTMSQGCGDESVCGGLRVAGGYISGWLDRPVSPLDGYWR
ncbi:hypothetical protein ACKUUI_22090 [Mycobacterium seoulense]|uniref:hypothetical protein n=1 Tax=Mycobacterium seoulense TaxID=386911 RepID=UPI003CEBDCC7